jgi:hypothetical protein
MNINFKMSKPIFFHILIIKYYKEGTNVDLSPT